MDGELPADSRARVRWHLLLCPGCRRHAQLVRAIKRTLAKRSGAVSGTETDIPAG